MRTSAFLGLIFPLCLSASIAEADTYRVNAKVYAVQVEQDQQLKTADGVDVQAGGLSHGTIVNRSGEESNQWCRGSWASDGEKFLGGGGHCVTIDADGEFLWIWFRPSGDGKNDWGVINGSGKWQGATGGGTTEVLSQSKDTRSWSMQSKGTIERR